ncbi:hypothetical protein F3J37_18085 [Pantoea sp. Al-1710]|uniref:Uncharacterized protein n=1 Tax=Candidatus Pantoea communis TaxID=2608354 RepID=A0ABX0RSL0_9GAMM|nr:hypothetical protein [Pantoea communis]NIG20588.1 hypothetical protein [Pantoea communis]
MSDAPSAFRQVTRTARKEHKCCECPHPIAPGDKYVYSSGIWEREPFGFKQCLICAEVSNAAAAITDDYGDKPTFSGLKDWFANQVCREFKGDEFVAVFARDMQVSPEKIWHVLGREFFNE